MPLSEIRKLGDPLLYKVSRVVKQGEIETLRPLILKMHRLILEFRKKYGAGRAIAAPQAGELKRIICLNVGEPQVLINVEIYDESDEMIEIWDDCMSFPELLVKVKRHKTCKVKFHDMNWKEHAWELKDDLSELLQHEYDHLNGILATQKAISVKHFKWRKNK
ncbi:MAG: peptide deformylase [Bacteroidetes bacterium]|nr:peptide deformylase [Bacteroidota bacterium]